MIALSLLLASAPTPFAAYGPFDGRFQDPESYLGYKLGSRISTYRDQDEYLKHLAAAYPDRIKIQSYGTSSEGRPLRVLIISNPDNIAHLGNIQKDAQHLANPAPGEDTSAIRKNHPAIVWVNECIHGNEPASFEAAMMTAYTLASSKNPEITSAMANSVVILNPVYNPDGHERYAVWYDSLNRGSALNNAIEHDEPDYIYGRVNHFRFDMNRDRVAMSQHETQLETAFFRTWWPQVYIDQHGQVNSYFFPPNAMSQNINVGRDTYTKWTDIFGRANAKAFDNNSWTYFVRDTFDLYYAGYLDIWTSLNGAIGMTYETDGGKAVGTLRDDGSLATLRGGLEKHYISAVTTIETAAKNRQGLLDSYAARRQENVTGKSTGNFKRVILTSDDPRPLKRFATQLDRQGIEYSWLREKLTQTDSHDYWKPGDKAGTTEFPAGSLVVDMAQPLGPLAKALLEPGSDFEPEFTKAQIQHRKDAGTKYRGGGGLEFYDTTAWSLPYAHDLKAWWCESAPQIPMSHDLLNGLLSKGSDAEVGDSPIGWVLPYRDDEDALAIIELMQKGVRVMVTPKNLQLAQGKVASGSFVILRQRNPDDPLAKIQEVGRKHGAHFEALTSGYPETERYGPGSADLFSLRRPEIGVVFGDSLDFSAPWHMFDSVWHIPFTAVPASTLDDPGRFSCLILPAGTYKVNEGFRKWLREGGCAVVTSGSDWAFAEFGKMEEVKVDGKQPAWLPGSLFKADLDPDSRLSYGYAPKDPIAVPLSGDKFYKPLADGGNVATIIKAETGNLLSGWGWTGETEKNVSGTVWMQEYRVGRGRVIVFQEDPLGRELWPGLRKLVLNSILLGPSPKNEPIE